MNPHTDQSSPTRDEESVPAEGLVKAPSSMAKPPARPDGMGLTLERYLGKPGQIQKIKTPLYIALGFLVVVDFFAHREHAAFIWDAIPGFSTFYGLIATVLIIFVSKFLGYGLMKPEDYYD